MAFVSTATVVQRSTSAVELADQLRAGLSVGVGRPLTGHGSRTCRIALDACRLAGRVAVYDPSGFSRQADARLATTDQTLSRPSRAAQPWTLAVYALEVEQVVPPGTHPEAVVEIDEGRLYLFFS
jgi:hypothetical protein